MHVMIKFLDGKRYNVYDKDQFPKSNIADYSTASFDKETGLIYPMRKLTDTEPGLYNSGMKLANGDPVYIQVEPTDEYKHLYGTDEGFVNFDSRDSLSQYIANVDKERQLSESVVSTVDNVYNIRIGQNDSPLSKLHKTAINAKHMDIYKYRDRIGANFNNDKRSCEASTITINKAGEIGKPMDISYFAIAMDSEDGVPNPMKDIYCVEINGRSDAQVRKLNIPGLREFLMDKSYEPEEAKEEEEQVDESDEVDDGSDLSFDYDEED